MHALPVTSLGGESEDTKSPALSSLRTEDYFSEDRRLFPKSKCKSRARSSYIIIAAAADTTVAEGAGAAAMCPTSIAAAEKGAGARVIRGWDAAVTRKTENDLPRSSAGKHVDVPADRRKRCCVHIGTSARFLHILLRISSAAP